MNPVPMNNDVCQDVVVCLPEKVEKSPLVDSDLHDTLDDLMTSFADSMQSRNQEMERENVPKDVENWRQLFSTQSEQFFYMYQNSIRTDCTFIVGPPGRQQIFCCHKIQLARSSPKFDAMFYEGDSKVSELVITKVDANIFQLLIEFIYTDHVELSSVEEALSLYSAASYYDMIHLCSSCVSYISLMFNPDNFWQAFQFAHVIEKYDDLKKKCVQYLQNNTKDCLKSESCIQEMTHSTLMTLVQQHTLNIDSELEVILVAIKWAQNQNNSKPIRTTFGSAFNFLRFLTLTPDEFAEHFSQSELLTVEEKFAIHIKLSHPENTINLPDTICCVKNPRKTPDMSCKQIPTSVTSKYFHTCYRKEINTIALKYGSTSSSSSAFIMLKVDHDINLFGVIVSSAQASVESKKLYTENITLEIYKYNSSDLAFEKVYKDEVLFNSKVRVMFEEPVKLKKNILYEIDITHESLDYSYNYFQREQVIVENGVTFNISNRIGDFNGLIEGFYFL